MLLLLLLLRGASEYCQRDVPAVNGRCLVELARFLVRCRWKCDAGGRCWRWEGPVHGTTTNNGDRRAVPVLPLFPRAAYAGSWLYKNMSTLKNVAKEIEPMRKISEFIWSTGMQSINQSIIQSINQSIDQSINQSIDGSINHLNPVWSHKKIEQKFTRNDRMEFCDDGEHPSPLSLLDEQSDSPIHSDDPCPFLASAVHWSTKFSALLPQLPRS